jgi:hypothetical protein
MNKETVIENELISMWYYPDKKILHHQVHKYVFGETLRNALDLGVEILKKNGACKWLSDDQSHSALPKDDVEWGKSIWTPKAIQAGWRHWAIVMPKSAAGRMSYKRMIEEYKAIGMNVNVLDDAEQAMTWLEAQ